MQVLPLPRRNSRNEKREKKVFNQFIQIEPIGPMSSIDYANACSCGTYCEHDHQTVAMFNKKFKGWSKDQLKYRKEEIENLLAATEKRQQLAVGLATAKVVAETIQGFKNLPWWKKLLF